MTDQPQCRTNWPEVFDRLEWLLLMAALAVVILVYPLRLQDSWLGALNDLWEEPHGFMRRWTGNELAAFVNFYYSPLILKGVLACFFMLLFIAVRLARPLLGIAGRPAACGRGAWLTVIAFFGWTCLSALWSPTPAISREVAYWAALHGAFLYMLLRRGMTAGEMRKLATMLMIFGIVVIVIAIFQFRQLFGGAIFKFMYRFPDERNLYGSLIGHNTAAASYAMMTAFAALAVLLGAKTEGRRAFSAVYLVLALFGILIFQSRAIWLIAPPLGAVAVVTLMRRAGKRRIPRLVIAGAALGAIALLTQILPNPLQRKDNMFARRLHDLSAESLQGEARLRLNAIGAPMVLERPFVGHGLFAFQYVYPKRQGEYFMRHPDSKLNQTVNRSNMAHNEYLQTAIDEGLIGLVLLLAVMFEVGRRGWRRRDRGLSDSDALLHRAFGWAALGLAIHALFDFPLHLPMLVVPGMLAMAAWASLRGGTEASAAPSAAPAIEPAARFRLVPFLRLLGVGGLALLMPVLSRPLFLKLESDIQANTGNGYYLGAQMPNVPTPYRFKMLQQAIDHGGVAAKLHPDNFMALLQLGDACLTRSEYLGQVLALVKPAERDRVKAEAIADARRARDCYARAAGGLQYHYIVYQQSQVARQLARLTGDPAEQAEYRAKIERTLEFCQAWTQAAGQLADLLDSQPRPDAARAAELRRLYLKHNPRQFDHEYVFPAYEALRERRFAEAARLWERILAVNPRKPEWIVAAASAQMYAGNRARALDLAEDFRRRDRPHYDSIGMWYFHELLLKDWPQLLKDLKVYAGIQNSRDRLIEFHIVEQEALARSGSRVKQDRFPRPGNIGEPAWERLIGERRPGILLFLFDDPQAARKAAREHIATGPPISYGFWIDACYIGRAAGDKDLVAQALAAMKAQNPNTAAYRDLSANSR